MTTNPTPEAEQAECKCGHSSVEHTLNERGVLKCIWKRCDCKGMNK